LFSKDLYAAKIFTITVPGQVNVGDPFPLIVTSQYPMKKLTVTWDNKNVSPSVTHKNGVFRSIVILGVGLKSKPGLYPLTVIINQKGTIQKLSKSIVVVSRVFSRERLRVAPRHIKPPKKVLKRIKRERYTSLKALNTISSNRYWNLPFSRPVKGKLLSRFGARRIFNGETKRRHTGLDFRAWMGTPIRSMADGRVILTGHFYFAGKCVFTDHGNGLVSLSCHMSKLLVKKGDSVVSGQKLGLSGATGRVTGAHLHLSVYSLGNSINPEPFFDGTIDFELKK
jgi:murein DD-endopeptidase MepM/ murein hydrolase activator NlpD